MSGSASRSKSYSYSRPWEGQEPYLSDIYSRARGLSYEPRTFYPSATYVPHSTETLAALEGVTERATTGDPLIGESQDYLSDVISGKYLDPESNPWLQESADAAARGVTRAYQTSVAPQTTGRFAGAGRMGSGAQYAAMNRDQDTLGRSLSELYSGFYGGAYEAERGRQQGALSQAIPYADYAYSDLSRLAEVGGAREDLDMRVLDDLMSRYYYEEDEPWQRLTDYAATIGAPVMETTQRASSSAGSGGLT